MNKKYLFEWWIAIQEVQIQVANQIMLWSLWRAKPTAVAKERFPIGCKTCDT